jgi:hypothetical protein
VVARLQETFAKIESAAADATELNWITKNPGAQSFTGSFTPISEPARHWYGEEYQPFYVGLGAMEVGLEVAKLRYTELCRGFPRDLWLYLVAHILTQIHKPAFDEVDLHWFPLM